MIVDEIKKLTVRAGDGGEGRMSFGKMAKSGPDGGNGGKGGDVYFQASSDLSLLRKFISNPKVKADDGDDGGKNKKTGKDGDDLVVDVPIGTLIEDIETGQKIELLKKGEIALLAEGGKGGTGNFELRSSTNTTPRETIPAEKGERRELKLTLRFLADFGLIGLPSAGKSSLLNELTNAKAKTAEYHFTTLSPNLGVIPKSQKIIADIPGLIEGASRGKGLGTKFLKHIQKVKLLLHCVAANSEDHLKDYKIIREELEEFDKKLLERKEIVIITKSDLVSGGKLKKIKNKFKKLDTKILSTSIHDLQSIKKLLKVLK